MTNELVSSSDPPRPSSSTRSGPLNSAGVACETRIRARTSSFGASDRRTRPSRTGVPASASSSNRPIRVAIAADSFAFKRALSRFGMAIEAMMAMIATTIISSMRVKPFSRLDMMFSVTTLC